MGGSGTARRATVAVLYESLLGGCEEELWIATSQAAQALDVNLLSVIGNGVRGDSEALYALAEDPAVDVVVAVSNALEPILPGSDLERLLARFRPRPVVSIGRAVPGAVSVLVQGGEGIGAIVRHLAEVHGRRRIAFIGGPPGSEEAEERLAGYRAALARLGLPWRPELVMPGDFRRPLAVEAVLAWHRQGTALDALICANDYMAIHAMRELQRLGVRVPEDVAVAGFDDIPETIAVTPTLTTARQPLRAVGEEAMRLALALVRGERAEGTRAHAAEPVLRRSCGCLGPGRSRAVRRPLDPALAGPARLAALAEQLDAAFSEVKAAVQVPDWSRQLLEELARELRGERGDRLTRVLEELISRFDPRRGIAARCHDILDLAFELLAPVEGRAAEEAWRTIREETLATVASLVEQRQMRFSVLRAEGYKGVVENYYWNGVLGEPELWKALQASLPELGIERLAVARYTDATRARAELSLRFGDAAAPGGGLPGEPFSPAALVSGAVAPGRRCDVVLFALLPSLGREGLALFEATARRSVPDPSLVHELRRRLSVTALMSELTRHAGELEGRVAERTRQLQEAQRQLVDAAHQAGMAEIAVGALHNVGNLLNSVSISAEAAGELLDGSRADGLARANDLLRDHQADLGAFFARDPRARLLPEYYGKVAAGLAEERASVRAALAEILERTRLVGETIRNLQEYAHNGLDVLFREETDLSAIADLALEVHAAQLSREQVRVERDYDRRAPRLVLPRAKIVHVMVNLVKNALDALARTPIDARRLRVEVGREGERLRVRVRDSGEGIPRENLERIFTYGFTTKASGHGFGLHTSANYVRQMGGTLAAESEGPGRGAAFTVTFEAGERPEPAQGRVKTASR